MPNSRSAMLLKCYLYLNTLDNFLMLSKIYNFKQPLSILYQPQGAYRLSALVAVRWSSLHPQSNIISQMINIVFVYK